jgi:uncharacterized linocin/CFP29 family protein
VTPETEALGWSQDIWDRLDEAVSSESKRSSIASTILPLVGPLPSAVTVPGDVIDADRLAIAEHLTRPIVELSAEFTLTTAQVAGEASLLTATSLATRAANLLAQAEDTLIFQGDAGNKLPVFTFVSQRQLAGDGLVASAPEEIVVQPIAANHYGERTFAAVAEGCAHLQAKGQYGPYALALQDAVYADTFAPLPGTLVSPADRIKPLVTQGYVGSGALPPSIGILLSVGGNTIDLVLARDAAVFFMNVDSAGLSHFRVWERFALRIKDNTALIRLRFA